MTFSNGHRVPPLPSEPPPSSAPPSSHSVIDTDGGDSSCCHHLLVPAYFSWPASPLLHGVAEGRANYFGNLQKGLLPAHRQRQQLPKGQQATSLLDLMTIRAFHSKMFRQFSLGTAVGFRIRGGKLTDIPAILVFVGRKVDRKWLGDGQSLPAALQGPGGVWCDVDVVEFSYYGAPAPTPKEQVYNELADGLRGNDPYIGPGSQVANQETYGTLSAIVRRQAGNRQVGFLTNRHVAIDLDFPNQKMFHPLPPSLGPGVYLGAVERATSFITDDLWYGIYASTNPETFVRADGAFIPFDDGFDMSTVMTVVRGIGEIGEVVDIDLQSPISRVIGQRVLKVGRSSGMSAGTILAYALEYNDEKGTCFLTDLLVVGENRQTFDLEGDSGSLIVLAGDNGHEKLRPIGIIWGGTANRGRLKLSGNWGPENWTSGVDLSRLLERLELSLITTDEALQAAIQEQRTLASMATAAKHSAASESSPATAAPLDDDKVGDEVIQPLGITVQLPLLHREDPEIAAEERQLICNFVGGTPSLPEFGSSPEDEFSVSLRLGGDRDGKRQRTNPGSGFDLEK